MRMARTAPLQIERGASMVLGVDSDPTATPSRSGRYMCSMGEPVDVMREILLWREAVPDPLHAIVGAARYRRVLESHPNSRTGGAP